MSTSGSSHAAAAADPCDRVQVVFASPRLLPPASKLSGRVVVLDVAFAADGMGTSFEGVTLSFIKDLGSRLAAWVDHHDHDRHPDFAADPRFVLCKKSQAGACPEMVTQALVREVGPIDTIVCHLDVDGLYAAAKWLRGGSEPYVGADDDARAIDTRIGTPGPIADRIDRALRAHFRDEALKHRVVRYLVAGCKPGEHHDVIAQAAADFDSMEAETQRLAALYEPRQQAVYLDAQRHAKKPFDKTELLLKGQALQPVAIVRHAGFVTLAAGFESGVDFLKQFNLSGGMPTRVSLPEKRLAEVLEKYPAK
jgi:hypothetical protein